MQAKYATRCAGCPERIQPGDAMARLGEPGSGRWVHAACHPDAEVAARTVTPPAPAGADAAAGLAATAGRTATAEGSATAGGGATARGSATARGGATAGGGAAIAAAKAKRTPARAARAAATPVPAGTIEVYTDGACAGNPGPGGWAWAVADGPQASGGEPVTTNQRMELTAALEAVRALDGDLVVVSDSTYVVNCFRNTWWRGWHERNWTNAAKKPVANRDLWEPLIDLVLARGDVTFRWVKGHAGDPMNELVDQLAVAAVVRPG